MTREWNLLLLNGPDVGEFIHSLALWHVGLGVFLSFGAIYFGLAGFTLLMTRRVLPFFQIGKRIDPRPLKPNQIKIEINRSLVSIGVFALYGVLTMALEKMNLLTIEWSWTPSDFLVDMLILVAWNELHFYICHASLHHKWLYKRFHIQHHWSVIPTPFSTFSFHYVEALMLSSVMILIMPFRDLNIAVMVLFPFVSLVMNNIGHMNYAVFPKLALGKMFSSCRRHTLHHTRIKGNYGFLVPYFDKIFDTRAKNVDYTQPLEKDV